MAEEKTSKSTEKSSERSNERRTDNRQNRPNRRYGKKTFYKKKECRFCKQKINSVDHKDYPLIKRFITEKGKIVPRRMSGNCAKHQRMIARAVKKARNIGIIPFTYK